LAIAVIGSATTTQIVGSLDRYTPPIDNRFVFMIVGPERSPT